MANIINAITTGAGGLSTTADASGSIQIATNNGTTAMTIDTSQNVGIGTASPSQLSTYRTLDVRGSTGGGFRFGNATDSGYLYSDSNETNIASATSKPLLFSTNTAERMRIDSSGNLLLGTTTTRGNFTIPSSGQIKPAGFTVTSGGGNYLGPLVTGQLAFASWNNGSGYALVAFQGTNTTLISSSNSAGGNNAFDTTNNQGSNSSNGAAMFVAGVNIYFQTKVNFTAAGSVYIMYLGG
jgi:hypothetical protein